MKKCPQCAEQIQQEAKVCRYCGAQFDAQGRAIMPNPLEVQTQRTVYTRQRTSPVTWFVFGIVMFLFASCAVAAFS